MKKVFWIMLVFVMIFSIQAQSLAAPTMEIVNDPQYIHLSAKAIRVVNTQNIAMTISNIKVAGHESQIQIYDLPNAINSCSATKTLDTSDSSCLIWLQAKNTNILGQAEPFNVPVSFDYSVDGNKTIKHVSKSYKITYENAVYVGGDFLKINNKAVSLPANHIAKWDGSTWSLLGIGENNGVNNDVHALVTNGLDLYVGGWFTTAGGLSSKHVAKWNGTWVPITNGPDDENNIYAMAAAANTVYVGGDVIGKINNDSFSPLADSPLGQITAMTTQPGTDILFIGDGSGGTAVRIGDSWSSLANKVNDSIFSMTFYNSNSIYIGGTYLSPESFLTKWDGHILSKVGLGIDAGQYIGVTSSVIADNKLYVGGQFVTLENTKTKANNVAVWDFKTASWAKLGGGAGYATNNDCVYALTIVGDKLFVGGTIQKIADLANPVNNIAMWDTKNNVWSNLAGGVSDGGNTVMALVAVPSITISSASN